MLFVYVSKTLCGAEFFLPHLESPTQTLSRAPNIIQGRKKVNAIRSRMLMPLD
jgi:hypothetical protein